MEGSFPEADGIGIAFAYVHRITWQGYEFLAAARNESVWQRAKSMIKAKSQDVPFSVLQAVLTDAAKQVFGMP